MSWPQNESVLPIKKKKPKKNSTIPSFFEMCCLHRHTGCENQLIARGEQHPLELYPYSRVPPDHGSWYKRDTAASANLSSPSATSRASARTQMEINSGTSVRDCLLSLSAVRSFLHFQLRTEEAVNGSWTKGIHVTHAKVLSTRQAGFSSPCCWGVQRTALFSVVSTLWAQLCHGMKPAWFISKALLATDSG